MRYELCDCYLPRYDANDPGKCIVSYIIVGPPYPPPDDCDINHDDEACKEELEDERPAEPWRERQEKKSAKRIHPRTKRLPIHRRKLFVYRRRFQAG